MVKKSSIIFFVLAIAFFALKVNAQIQSADISLNINPEFPKANENVTASVETYSTDLNNARITWTLDGQTVLEGMGKKTYSFTLGLSGSQSILEVHIETLDGSSIDKSISISPSSVDMLWMAYNTYVPPFYKGKALAPLEGSVKIVAMPSTQNLAGLNYKWKEDGKSNQSLSGYEKNYFIYRNTYLENSNDIEVSISDIFGNNVGLGKTLINYGSPKVIFYQKDPILGTRWENALTNGFSINTNGDTIVAEPYFFSNKDLNSSTSEIKWSLNGTKTATPSPKNILSIKPESGTSGSTAIKVIINNNKTWFQSVEKTLNVNF